MTYTNKEDKGLGSFGIVKKNGQIMGVYLVIITLVMIFVAMGVFLFQQGKIDNSMVSPEDVLSISSQKDFFEIIENTFLEVSAKDVIYEKENLNIKVADKDLNNLKKGVVVYMVLFNSEKSSYAHCYYKFNKGVWWIACEFDSSLDGNPFFPFGVNFANKVNPSESLEEGFEGIVSNFNVAEEEKRIVVSANGKEVSSTDKNFEVNDVFPKIEKFEEVGLKKEWCDEKLASGIKKVFINYLIKFEEIREDKVLFLFPSDSVDLFFNGKKLTREILSEEENKKNFLNDLYSFKCSEKDDEQFLNVSRKKLLKKFRIFPKDAKVKNSFLVDIEFEFGRNEYLRDYESVSPGKSWAREKKSIERMISKKIVTEEYANQIVEECLWADEMVARPSLYLESIKRRFSYDSEKKVFDICGSNIVQAVKGRKEEFKKCVSDFLGSGWSVELMCDGLNLEFIITLKNLEKKVIRDDIKLTLGIKSREDN